MIFPGWVIARAIPYKYLAGLVTGQYSLTGGVIRYAAGTARGGQIVAHLLPAASNMIPGLNFLPGVIANFQLHHLSGAVNVLGTQITSLSMLNSFNSYQLMKLSSQVNSLTRRRFQNGQTSSKAKQTMSSTCTLSLASTIASSNQRRATRASRSGI